MKRLSNQQTIQQAIEQFFLQSPNLREGRIRHKIIHAWKDFVGEMIAKNTTDIWYQNYVLTVHIQSSVIRQEVTYHLNDLIQKINTHLEDELVKKIILR